MFDTLKIAKKIRETRIARNMTQMNLADAMGVSYQAVSNWERGSSMPDIAKLEDLCRALNITVSELLGMENRETAVVEKVLKEEALTVSELAEVAPILPPAQMEAQTRRAGKGCNISALVEIAPFLDDDLLEELLADIQVESLSDLVPVVPFLDEGVLDELVRKASRADIQGVVALAPFLDEDTLDWVVRHWDLESDGKELEALAPFLDEDTLDVLVERQIARGQVKTLAGLYPFMGEDALRKVAKALMASGDMEGMKEAVIFL